MNRFPKDVIGLPKPCLGVTVSHDRTAVAHFGRPAPDRSRRETLHGVTDIPSRLRTRDDGEAIHLGTQVADPVMPRRRLALQHDQAFQRALDDVAGQVGSAVEPLRTEKLPGIE